MTFENVPEKNALRASMRERRSALSQAQQRELSRLACERLLASEDWKNAPVVALYIAVRGETDCGLLLQDAWEKGKTVLLPLCVPGRKGEMRFVPCSGPDKLRPGAYGIPEPVEDAASSATPFLVPALIIVPGVAFDRAGNRLGMGGGYYDRLLAGATYSRCLRVGFAYSFQVTDRLPVEKLDVPVHALCTDAELIRISTP